MANQTLEAYLDSLTELGAADSAADFLLIKDTSTSSLKRITPDNLGITGGSAASVYIASITQTGTSNPVATVAENTLGGTVVWTRAGVGNYQGALTGAFAGTFVAQLTSDFNGLHLLAFVNHDDNTIIIRTTSETGGNAECDGGELFLSVSVYP